MSSTLKRKQRKANQTGRSKGGERFVGLYHWMLQSPAWQKLSPNARALLIEIWAIYNGNNNGEIAFSVRTAAARLNIATNTAHKALRELEESGFIKANIRGHFDYKKNHATTWIITAFEYNGQPATKDFMSCGHLTKKNPVAIDNTAGLTA